jgi:uncharacterized protein (DUF1501 family)
MRRRHLLSAAAAPLLFPSGQLFAAPAAQSRLLVVFLRGGYDAANLLIPVSSSFYDEARPNLAIARPSADLNSALQVDADWGLHPSLRNTIYPLFKKGQVVFVPFAGTDDMSRSHFETQDSIELGQAAGNHQNFRSGFLNRLASVLTGAEPIAFTDQLPMIFQGSQQVPNIALRTLNAPAVDQRQSSIIASMYRGTAMGQQVEEGFSVRAEALRDMAGEMQAAGRNAITAKGFEQEARRIARLMQDRYHLGFVDVGGWDTHINQGAATGYLASRFEELGQGLAAFAQEMGAAWRDTTVVVLSEFGRTFRQNGNRGTDHGHGSVYWILGGSVRGGRVAGEQQRVEQSTLFQNRDYPVLNEYRAVLAGLFARQFGLSPREQDAIFAGVKARDIGLL